MTEIILDTPEKRIYPGKMAAQDYKIKLAEEKIEWAQKVMLILAFFAFIKLIRFAFTDYYSIEDKMIDVAFQTIVIIVYVACSFLTKKSPKLAIGLVLGFYFFIQATLTYFHGFEYLHTGITFKIALISFIVYGLFYSIKVKMMRKELEEEYQNYLLKSLRDK